MSVNVEGVVNTVSASIESVIASRGQLVLVSSVFAYINGAGAIPYAMSKAAVEQLGRGLRVELARHGASATTAYPPPFGWAPSPAKASFDQVGEAKRSWQIPRYGTPIRSHSLA